MRAAGGGRSEGDKGENKKHRKRATAYATEATIFSSGPFKSHPYSGREDNRCVEGCCFYNV